VLIPGGLLLIYGPFKRHGKPTTESNAQFDHSLRLQNPKWGYRCAQRPQRTRRELALQLLGGLCVAVVNVRSTTYTKGAQVNGACTFTALADVPTPV
jgi:hypothetical protein